MRVRLRAQAVSEGVADRVQFTGALSHADALRTMATCDVLASLSTHEGLPHVVLEARALGLVVVATDAGGTVEALGDSTRHVVVEGEDEAALVAASSSKVPTGSPRSAKPGIGLSSITRMISPTVPRW